MALASTNSDASPNLTVDSFGAVETKSIVLGETSELTVIGDANADETAPIGDPTIQLGAVEAGEVRVRNEGPAATGRNDSILLSSVHAQDDADGDNVSLTIRNADHLRFTGDVTASTGISVTEVNTVEVTSTDLVAQDGLLSIGDDTANAGDANVDGIRLTGADDTRVRFLASGDSTTVPTEDGDVHLTDVTVDNGDTDDVDVVVGAEGDAVLDVMDLGNGDLTATIDADEPNGGPEGARTGIVGDGTTAIASAGAVELIGYTDDTWTVNGAVTAGAFETTGTGGTTTFTGNVTTGGDQVYDNDVLLTDPNDHTFTSTGGDVIFNGRVEAELDGADTETDGASDEGLTVNTPAGDNIFNGEVGSGVAGGDDTAADDDGLEFLVTDDSNTITPFGVTELGADLTAAGSSMTFNDDVVLTDSITVTDLGDVTFEGTVDGGHDLTLEVSGRTEFWDAVGGVTALGTGDVPAPSTSITIDSTGVTEFIDADGTDSVPTVRTNAGIDQDDGAGEVIFNEDVRVLTDAVGTTFDADVELDGVTFRSAGPVTFGDEGSDALEVTDTTTVTTDSPALAGSTVTLNGDTTLDADLTVASGDADILISGTATVDGNSDLVLNSAGTTDVDGRVGGTIPIASITTDDAQNAADTTEIGNDIDAQGGTMTYNDPVELTDDVTLTDTGTTGVRFRSTLDSDGTTPRDLTLDVDADVLFAGEVGGVNRLGDVLIDDVGGSGTEVDNVTAEADVTVDTFTQLGGDADTTVEGALTARGPDEADADTNGNGNTVEVRTTGDIQVDGLVDARGGADTGADGGQDGGAVVLTSAEESIELGGINTSGSDAASGAAAAGGNAGDVILEPDTGTSVAAGGYVQPGDSASDGMITLNGDVHADGGAGDGVGSAGDGGEVTIGPAGRGVNALGVASVVGHNADGLLEITARGGGATGEVDVGADEKLTSLGDGTAGSGDVLLSATEEVAFGDVNVDGTLRVDGSGTADVTLYLRDPDPVLEADGVVRGDQGMDVIVRGGIKVFGFDEITTFTVTGNGDADPQLGSVNPRKIDAFLLNHYLIRKLDGFPALTRSGTVLDARARGPVFGLGNKLRRSLGSWMELPGVPSSNRPVGLPEGVVAMRVPQLSQLDTDRAGTGAGISAGETWFDRAFDEYFGYREWHLDLINAWNLLLEETGTEEDEEEEGEETQEGESEGPEENTN